MPGSPERATRRPHGSACGPQRDSARISVHGERSGRATSARRSTADGPAFGSGVRNAGRHHAEPGARVSSRSWPCVRRPHGPSNETQNPNDSAAMTRCGSSRCRSRTKLALAPAIRSKVPLSSPARTLSYQAAPYRSPNMRFMALRRATSRPCSSPQMAALTAVFQTWS